MKRDYAIFIIAILTIFLYGCSLSVQNKSGQETLDSIARPMMNSAARYVDNWYLFHKDRIYVYLFENGKDLFFSTDLKGNNKKIISQSDDLRYAELYLIYDNYAFYYTTYHQGIKKINIETGEIYNVIDNIYLYLIPDTLQDGKVLVQYANNYLDEAHVYIGKLDLKSGILSDGKILPYVGNQTYYYSRGNDKVYFIDSDNNSTNYLYEDNSIIYTYPSIMNNNDFVFTQDDYIFLVTTNKIFKFDINEHNIIEEKSLNNSGFQLYGSIRDRSFRFKKVEHTVPLSNLLKPIVYSRDNGAYRFDSEKMEFEMITNIGYAFVQKTNNYLIFQGIVSTAIYDEVTGKTATFSSTNFGVDDETIYIMSFYGDFYYQNSSKCDFKVEKIRLSSNL